VIVENAPESVDLWYIGPELSTGDGFQLVCFDANQSALAFGADCSPDPALGMRCADDTLCIAGPGSASKFCSRMCRNDPDCPADARCLEVPTPVALSDGRRPVIGMCTPASKITGKVCVREADCDPGQGCVNYGGRTSLRVCRAGGAKACPSSPRRRWPRAPTASSWSSTPTRTRRSATGPAAWRWIPPAACWPH